MSDNKKIYYIEYDSVYQDDINRLLGADIIKNGLRWLYLSVYSFYRELSDEDVTILRLGLPNDAIIRMSTLEDRTYDRHNTY